MKSKTNRREKLEKQLAKAKARLQSFEAREKTSERKKDIRRKILIGAYYLDQAEKHNTMDDLEALRACSKSYEIM